MPGKLKDILVEKLTKKELSLVPSSFDMVGNTIIFSDFLDVLLGSIARFYWRKDKTGVISHSASRIFYLMIFFPFS